MSHKYLLRRPKRYRYFSCNRTLTYCKVFQHSIPDFWRCSFLHSSSGLSNWHAECEGCYHSRFCAFQHRFLVWWDCHEFDSHSRPGILCLSWFPRSNQFYVLGDLFLCVSLTFHNKFLMLHHKAHQWFFHFCQTIDRVCGLLQLLWNLIY